MRFKRQTSELCRRDVSKGLPCLVDIYVLAGVNMACEVCAPHVQKMRDIDGWKTGGHGFFQSGRITPDQQSAVATAIQRRIDEAGELAAHEHLYGREDRELQLQRHGGECDCDDCESARHALRRL